MMKHCAVCDDETEDLYIMGDVRVCQSCREFVLQKEAWKDYAVSIERAVDAAWEKNG